MSPDERGLGPPKEEPGATPGAGPHHSSHTSHHHTAGCRHSMGSTPRGCYDGPYDPWRAGFRRGAIDALRLAARRIDDPHVWLVLSELRECYETEQCGLAG